MIIAVTPNPAWDTTYQVDALAPGEVHRVRSVALRPGGKGVNVARVLRTLGHEVTAFFPAGGATAHAFVRGLDDAGIDAIGVPISGEIRRSVAVLPTAAGEADDGHPTVFNEMGPMVAADEWSALIDAAVQRCRPGIVATVSGSLPAGVDRDRYSALITALKGAGAVVYVDVSGPALRWACEAGADLVKPNRDELREATGTADLREGADALRLLGVGAAVVTMGGDGLWVFGDDLPARGLGCRLDATVEGNPTGAGDAVFAALAASHGRAWRTRLEHAVTVGAAAVLGPLAGDLDATAIPELIQYVRHLTTIEEVESP